MIAGSNQPKCSVIGGDEVKEERESRPRWLCRTNLDVLAMALRHGGYAIASVRRTRVATKAGREGVKAAVEIHAVCEASR